MLILETQQSSDVTYRVYDYDRWWSDDGKPRGLASSTESWEVIDYARKLQHLEKQLQKLTAKLSL